jgi:hypothetical protein
MLGMYLEFEQQRRVWDQSAIKIVGRILTDDAAVGDQLVGYVASCWSDELRGIAAGGGGDLLARAVKRLGSAAWVDGLIGHGFAFASGDLYARIIELTDSSKLEEWARGGFSKVSQTSLQELAEDEAAVLAVREYVEAARRAGRASPLPSAFLDAVVERIVAISESEPDPFISGLVDLFHDSFRNEIDERTAKEIVSRRPISLGLLESIPVTASLGNSVLVDPGASELFREIVEDANERGLAWAARVVEASSLPSIRKLKKSSLPDRIKEAIGDALPDSVERTGLTKLADVLRIK